MRKGIISGYSTLQRNRPNISRKSRGEFDDDELWRDIPRDAFVGEQPAFQQGEVTGAELRSVIRKMKRGKAPGPDEKSAELFKELDGENRETLKNIVNE